MTNYVICPRHDPNTFITEVENGHKYKWTTDLTAAKRYTAEQRKDVFLEGPAEFRRLTEAEMKELT